MSKQKKSLYGYCAITADFLHIGHIRLFEACRLRCKRLIVGIMTDECVESYKGKKPVMDFVQRSQLVLSVKGIYKIFVQDSFEFPHHVLTLKDVYGDDFIIFDNEKHNRLNADVLIPYLEGISSTKLKAEYL